MALWVQKFGGTSVGTPERIQAVAQRIAHVRATGNQLVVVVSAMGDTTDELIALAHQITPEPAHREMDMLLTAGERISMALLSMALKSLGVDAVSFTGSQSGIITTDSHRRARIRRILGDRVRVAIADQKVAIVAGFQGVSEKKEITTLGRGGSDTTAVALAAVLKADRCEIYTDVAGVYSADPRIVPNAHRWDCLPAELMIELAWRGAGVLHSRCVEMAREHQVELHVKNSLRSENEAAEGTEIMTKSVNQLSGRGLEEFGIAGITADTSKALLVVELMRPTASGAVWELARDRQLSFISPSFAEGRLQMFVDCDAEKEWVKHLQQLAADGFIKSFSFDSGTIPLSVVGSRLTQDGAVLQQVTESLAQSGIWVTMGAASPLALTVAVPRTHAEDGVRLLHEKFFATP